MVAHGWRAISVTYQRCFEHLDHFDNFNCWCWTWVSLYKDWIFLLLLPDHLVLQKVPIHRCLELYGTLCINLSILAGLESGEPLYCCLYTLGIQYYCFLSYQWLQLHVLQKFVLVKSYFTRYWLAEKEQHDLLSWHAGTLEMSMVQFLY